MRASLLQWLPLAAAAVIPPLQPRDARGKSHTDGRKTSSTDGSTNGWPGGQCGSVKSSNATSLTIAQTPSSSAYVVPGDFIGFGFDSAFLNNYGGDFSQNLVNNVVDRIPGPIILRIGGTSQDKFTYDPNQKEATNCIGSGCPAGPGTKFILGPSYFDGFKNFPNQLMSFQAPISPKLNNTNILDYVTLAYKNLGADRTAAIALGNEVDLYQRDYQITYTAADYAQDANTAIKLIQNALGLSSSDVIFESPDIAGYGNFGLPDVFEAGLDVSVIKYAAEHWYQINGGTSNPDYANEQSLLESHDAITNKYQSTGYYDALNYVQTNTKSKYILSETGSSLAGSPRYFQDAFDATLWLVDFHLYSMSIGVQRIDSTQRPSANHSLWVPDSSSNDPSLGAQYNPGPQVRAPWYGIPMIADFIGKSPGAVVSLLAEDQATAYAMYEPPGWWNGDKGASAASAGPPHSWGQQGPSKVAITNLKLWANDLGTPRGSRTFAIPVAGGQGHGVVKVARLHADNGVAAQGYDVQGDSGMITWAGETWSYSLDDGKGSTVAGTPAYEEVSVCDGYAVVEVPDSEAVIVYLTQENGAP